VLVFVKSCGVYVMKRLVCGAVILLVFADCLDTVNNRPVKVNSGNGFEASGGVKVVIEGDGVFPEELAGRWKAKGPSGWEIVFEKDGSISSAVVDIGGAEMFPGQVTTFETVGGGKGIYRPGGWLVEYNAQSRKLAVTIEIENFYQDLGENSVTGSSADIFTGPVDKEKLQWEAEWYSFPTYVINVDNEQHELPVDANDNPHGILTFKKVELSE